MYYVIDKKGLYDRIYEQVSFVADDAYVEGGQSLYDEVILTEKDKPKVYRCIDDAVSSFVQRAFDICKYSPLVVYAQAEDGQGHRLYYESDGGGHPTDTTTTTITAFPVYTSTVASVTPRLVINVPDFDVDNTDYALEEVSWYIVLSVVTDICVERRPSVAPQFAEKTKVALDKTINLLKTRKAPNEQWS